MSLSKVPFQKKLFLKYVCREYIHLKMDILSQNMWTYCHHKNVYPFLLNYLYTKRKIKKKQNHANGTVMNVVSQH